MTTTLICRGQGDVARWCGVQPAAVSNWMVRHAGEVPAPDAEVHNEKSTLVIRGWLPARRAEWEQFSADRGERMAAAVVSSSATRRARRTAALIEQGVAAGRINPLEAVKLLAELLGVPGSGEG